MGQLTIHDMDQLRNVNEKRVWNILPSFLDTVDNNVCQCNICIIDIVAITLNNLKPCYQFDENMASAEKIVPDEEIWNQLSKAVKKVSSKPHH